MSTTPPGTVAPQPRRRGRRRQQTLERVLGTPALFATAYGNVGSSIYYALGLVAGIALGLTPLVFVISGLIFAATAATYAEGTVRYPEAGGSSSFARHAFNELVSFGAAWAQMLNYIITIAISAFFVPHYLSIFWGPLRENPWDIVGGVVVVVFLVLLNVIGIREAARLNILLAVIDFATQLLLVIIGFALIFDPHIVFSANIHWGVAPTWSQFFLAIPIAMIAYTGIETVSNLAEEARDPPRDIPRSITWVAGAVFAIYFTLPLIALSALPVREDRERLSDATRPRAGAGRLQERSGARPGRAPRLPRPGAARVEDLRRDPRGDDSAHRHERGRDRRVADHVRDGDPPAAARGVPPAASKVQDAVAVARRLRRDHLDPRPAPRPDGLSREHVRVRRDAVVHDRARLGDRSARQIARRRRGVQGPPEYPRARRRLAALRDLRRRWAPGSPGWSSWFRSRRPGGSGWAGSSPA